MAEECIRMQTFETRSAFEVPISETHEWHSNIRMQDGETFECIRMHIPSTCELDLYSSTAAAAAAVDILLPITADDHRYCRSAAELVACSFQITISRRSKLA